MPLVGDVILACREQMPDMPQVFAPPIIVTAIPGTGGTLPAGTNYYVVATVTNNWGETLPSVEVGPLTVAANGLITVTVTAPIGTLLARAYVGFAGPGSESFYNIQSSFVAGNAVVVVGGAVPAIGGQPPSFNTAFNPDSDGSSIGVYTLFRWFNDAVQELSRIAGGILDMTGVQANVLASDYVIPSVPCPWIRFTDAWFDGYFCQDFKRRNQWRRQFIGAISFYWSVEQVNRQMVLNFYPAPNRNGTTSSIASTIGPDNSVIPLQSIPAGMMFPGMCQIDNEVVIYSTSSGTSLTGCIRGMSGTTPAVHTSLAPVTEFNLVLAGFRQPNTYVPGNSGLTLSVPVGWEIPISNFVLARYKNYEQNQAEATAYYKAFIEEAKRIAFDSRQFPSSAAIGGPASFLTLYPGGPFGVIVP